VELEQGLLVCQLDVGSTGDLLEFWIDVSMPYGKNDTSMSNDHLFRSSRTGQNIKLPSSISGTELPAARTVLAITAMHASDEMMDRICIISVCV